MAALQAEHVASFEKPFSRFPFRYHFLKLYNRRKCYPAHRAVNFYIIKIKNNAAYTRKWYKKDMKMFANRMERGRREKKSE